MRHLVSIRDLSTEDIRGLVDQAVGSEKENEQGGPNEIHSRPGELVGLVFLEASSRTRVSFECAAHALEAKPILVQQAGSSLEKSESLKDTILIFRSMGIKVFVVRCKSENDLLELTKISGVSIINAGDGKREHPTQALLDLTTLRSLYSWEKLAGKTLCIIGDLKNSRVAQSWSLLAPKVGIKLKLASPEGWKPDWGKDFEHSTNLREGIKGADFIMSLRVQKERHSGPSDTITQEFVNEFQMTENKLPAKALLMHPGPVNWGVELADDLQNHAQSLILLQVKYGVNLRKAVLSKIFDALLRDR